MAINSLMVRNKSVDIQSSFGPRNAPSLRNTILKVVPFDENISSQHQVTLCGKAQQECWQAYLLASLVTFFIVFSIYVGAYIYCGLHY